jgi:peptidoglycan/LPS O-acetylase OafA/YrhL
MKQGIGRNAFDLIRLLAALQVAVLHAAEYLRPELLQAWWVKGLVLFPGVPIFFFISGFLISRSYETNSDLRDYAQNRALRIFPALAVCVALNLVAVASTGYFAQVSAGVGDVLLLGIAKSTILQFYNPDFMRAFGDGVLNGSLWTICVELQFYFLVPILYRLLARADRRQQNLRLLALAIGFLAFNRALDVLRDGYAETVAWKLFYVSFLPWFYMFLGGVLAQRNLGWLLSRVRRIPLRWLVLGYVAYGLLVVAAGLELGNTLSPLIYVPLALVVLRGAFSRLTDAADLLKRNDISYGVYIYHMPIVNQLLFYEYSGLVVLLVALAGSVLAATLSWFLVEKPCLRLKRRPMHSVKA